MKHKRFIFWMPGLCLLLTAVFGILSPAWANQPPAAAAVDDAVTLPVPAAPQASQFQITLPPTADSYVTSAYPNTNYGLDADLQVSLSGTYPNTVFKRSLLAFDLSDIPANAVILTATLRLYSEFNATQAAVPHAPQDSIINTYAIDEPWEETAVTYSNHPAVTPRGDPPASYVFDGWTEWDLTNMVSGWVAGDYANYGVWLTTGLQESAYWLSRNAASINFPRLVITYQTAGSPLWAQVTSDTWVSQANPNTNYNNDTSLSVSRSSGGSQNHALLKFDLADLPPNIAVTDARLEMYSILNRGNTPDAPLAFAVYPDAIMADWNPATVTWNSKPVTLNVGDAGVTPIYNSWTQWNVTNIVQGWVEGTRPNYGIALRPGATDVGFHYFMALPGLDAARLIVSYEEICNPPTGVTISGVTQGSTNTAYTFVASVSPANVTPPLSFSWTATEQTPVTEPDGEVSFTWGTAGTKTVNVTVSGCGGSASASHTVLVNEPPPSCDEPLTGLALSGPTTGVTGVPYSFTGLATPANATLPITHTWQATDQVEEMIVGGVNTAVAYTWAITGSKEIALESVNCGASFVRYHTINIQPRPDLTISGAWYDINQERLYYIVKNVGGSDIPAGHITQLYRDGTAVASATFEETLTPGAMRVGSLPFAWSCAAPAAEMRVCADATNLVPEESEANNCFQESWSCDQVPPFFSSGPMVDQITETTARIYWQTNEMTTGQLTITGMGGPYGDPYASTLSGTIHQIIVTGLEPDRTYRYQIVATDGSGNQAQTADSFFRTATACSNQPIISNLAIEQLSPSDYEVYRVSATVDVPACMERLSFFWDGQLIGRDYSPNEDGAFEMVLSPHALGLTREQFFGAPKELRVQAYSLGSATAVSTRNITLPAQPISAIVDPPAEPFIAYTASGTVPIGTFVNITVYAAEFEWACTYDGSGTPAGVPPIPCADVRSPVQSLYFRLDGQNKGGITDPDLIATYPMHIAGLSLGAHTAEVCATLSDNSQRCATQQILVEQGATDVQTTHTVSRVGNYFQVDITLTNQGTARAYVERVRDMVQGFQPADRVFSDDYGTAVWYVHSTKSAYIDLITPAGSPVPLLPGQSYTFSYVMSPILYEQPSTPSGLAQLTITYREDSITGPRQIISVARSFHVVHDGVGGAFVPLADAVSDAFATADYLIVTNPTHLSQISAATVDGVIITSRHVLAKMAHLASLKKGVLGYLDSNDEAMLDHLVDPRKGLHWTQSLHPNFGIKNKGYVLIVGETEVVPSYYVGGDHFTTYVNIPDHVYQSDLPFANTGGNTARPELVVGRIIGNKTGDLFRQLSLTVDVYAGTGDRTFDRSHALVISGSGDGDSGNFVPTVNIIRDVLAGHGWQVTKFHASENPGDDITDFNVWKPWAINQDFVLFRDHGSLNGWGGMLGTSNVSELNLPDGDSAPAAFAVACLAGNYERDDDYNLAEAFLENGGAVYIGSTEISERTTNSYAAKWFVRNWPGNQTIGVTLNNTKIAVWDTDSGWEAFDHEKLWAYEYNLYGCPKFGVTGAETAVQPAALLSPTTELVVQVPDLEITTVGDYDQVEIPGGLLRMTPGGLQTPYWTVRVDYPAGTRVTGVQLATLGAPTVLAGLNLPVTEPGIDCIGCGELPAPDPLDIAGWVPDLAQKYAWAVEENSDGSSTLWLRIYPFFYKMETGDALFYQSFAFDVTVLPTAVEITSWQAEAARYGLGETAVAHLHLSQTGAPLDVVVEAAVKPLVVETAVASFPLRLLTGLDGAASLEFAWETAGFDPGQYRLEVRVRDLSGNLLDSDTTEIRLGRLSGEGTALTADPPIFQPGAAVAISFSFRNRGDMALDGTAVIQVQGADLMATAVFTHAITALPPGEMLTFHNVWATTGMPAGDYRVVAYASYGGGISTPLSRSLSTNRYVYLPMVIRH